MFSELWSWVKGALNKMIGQSTVEQTLNLTCPISYKMANAIERWTKMYEGNPPWVHEPNDVDKTRVVSLGIPAFIASEKARMATLEMETEITPPLKKVKTDTSTSAGMTKGNDTAGVEDTENESSDGSGVNADSEVIEVGSARADYLNEQYKKLKRQIRTQLEYGIAKGGLVIKPYPVIPADAKDKGTIEFDYTQADAFFPLGFSHSGKIIEAAFVQRRVDGDNCFSRIEWHKLEGRTVRVRNLAFKSKSTVYIDFKNLFTADLGQPIPLTDVPEWATLEPETIVEDVDRLLFAYFKMPEANTIDSRSPIGVSGYSRVESLIKDADEQYSRLLWEFEGGELAVDVDRDALKLTKDAKGNDITVLPSTQERLFRKIDLNQEDTYEVFSPPLRDVSILNGLNEILQRIEDNTGLSRGTLSNAYTTEARTATELKILKQRSYATNADIQYALEDALRDAIYVMNVYCDLYNLAPKGEYEASFEWDDSILVDIDTELAKRITLMQNGLVSKVENRMWYFGETESQAKKALEDIAKEQEIDNQRKMEQQQQMMAKGIDNSLGTPFGNQPGKETQKPLPRQNDNPADEKKEPPKK